MHNNKGYTLVELLIAIWMFFIFLLFIGVIYAVVHFILKYW